MTIFRIHPCCFKLLAMRFPVALGVLLIFAGPIFARTDPDDINIDVKFGFGGYYKIETPTPISVRVTNNGDDFDGWALANLESWVPPTYYTQPLVIPSGVSRSLEFECFGCYEPGECNADVRILGQNGDPLKIQEISPWMLYRADTLFVHLGEPAGDISHLFTGINPGYISMAFEGLFLSSGSYSYSPKIFPVILSPDELPSNFILMEGVGTVAMRIGTYLALDENTKLMLFEYISQGGNLIVYYNHTEDPIDGWAPETLLPVTPTGRTSSLITDLVESTVDDIFRDSNFMDFAPPPVEGRRRGIRGEIIDAPVTTDDEESLDFQNVGSYLGVDEWDPPKYYEYLEIDPEPDSEVIYYADKPALVIRNLGSGHVGFIPYDPFKGGPTAQDPTIMLLGASGLLDPECPTQRLSSMATSNFRILNNSNVLNFFRQGTLDGQNIVMRWLDALGPILIYLIVLPILVLLARRRGQMVLALLVIWSVGFTVFILVSRVNPPVNKVQVNEAALLWCEAQKPGIAVSDRTSSAVSYSIMSYSAGTSAPHTPSWNYPGAVLDEIVNPDQWPYGNLTVEKSDGLKLPDLRLETITFRSTGSGDRTFTMRRPARELTASGQLVVAPDTARVQIDAELPFQVIASKLVVDSHNMLWVRKDTGPFENSIHIDSELDNGTEIRRYEPLFPGHPEDVADQTAESEAQSETAEMGRTLESWLNLVMSMPVQRGQDYTESRFTERPTRAYLVMASAEIPSELRVDRGEIEHHAVTIIVISVPIVYKSAS